MAFARFEVPGISKTCKGHLAFGEYLHTPPPRFVDFAARNWAVLLAMSFGRPTEQISHRRRVRCCINCGARIGGRFVVSYLVYGPNRPLDSNSARFLVACRNIRETRQQSWSGANNR